MSGLIIIVNLLFYTYRGALIDISSGRSSLSGNPNLGPFYEKSKNIHFSIEVEPRVVRWIDDKNRLSIASIILYNILDYNTRYTAIIEQYYTILELHNI